MVEQEDGEDFIVDIVGEIVEATMKILHDKYIEKQTLPYTVLETKNLLLQIIEVWRDRQLNLIFLLIDAVVAYNYINNYIIGMYINNKGFSNSIIL